jgi:transcriptional regulator with GAF, ATPase, and Fis domain
MDSQRSDTEPGNTHRVRNNPRIVIVNHAPTEAAVAIDDVIASCAVVPRRVSPGSHIDRRADECGIALVVADGPPSFQAPVLEDVRRLKIGGFVVLCCARDANTWPLGVRCRLLISGAAEVFDSTASGFTHDLRQRLDELLAAEAGREREIGQLRQQMLRLGVVGNSPRITDAFRSIVRVSAVTDLPVLITGETGTGKELAARAVHQLDPRRRDRPFIAVNCGAISAGLAESDLFGHRRGAFTGAEHERMGLVRAARGGVLFLDEIGDLDAGLQAKLLRVLQERRVLAVGDDHEVAVDVRIVAATNRDLEEMVRLRTFRADLFHRLNVLTIRLPALRDRPEDIEPLVTHFVARCGGGRAETVFASREFVEALRQVDLPGNIRQLENVVRRAVVAASHGEQLRLSSLPPEFWQELARSGVDATEPSRIRDASTPLDPVAILEASAWKLDGALALCEQQLVAAALGASRGNRSRAARLLGISPRCIFNKMRKHRLSA